MLGRLLMDEEVDAYDGSETWVEALLRNPAHRDEIAAEVRAVAEELADAELDESPRAGRGGARALPASSPAASSAASYADLRERRHAGRSPRTPLR